jgi:hypothetical protein
MDRLWLLTVGEYADTQVLGVVRGSRTDANRRAADMTSIRAQDGEPDDMTYVAVAEVEDLSGPDAGTCADGATVYLPRTEYDRWVATLGSAHTVLGKILDRIDGAQEPGDVIPDSAVRSDLSGLGNWVQAVYRRMERVTR